jgi:hypothetical protein
VSVELRESGTEERLSQMQARVLSLEEQVAELTQRLDNTVSSLVKLTQYVRGLQAPQAASPAPAREAAPEAASATPRMLEVVKLVQQGKGEEAQALLQSMPQQELTAQPAIVALAAATLCLQRGDIAACLKALKRARGFTSDPRLLKVLERVEAKAQSQNG